jgi:16S rRNA (cytidine1402-2'-O)-methyltransferase
MTSYREHTEARETPKLIARLQAGESIALVSDAGTPGIADPGARLVRAALDANLPVVPIPGASAVAAALSASGVDASEFVFMGFPPASGTARQRWMDRLAAERRPVVLFEAPHRIARTWAELGDLGENNRIIAFRELTKINEELVVQQNQCLPVLHERGEFVVIVTREDDGDTPKQPEIEASALDLGLRMMAALENAGFGKGEVAELTSRALGEDPKAFAKRLKKHKILAKRQKNAAS